MKYTLNIKIPQDVIAIKSVSIQVKDTTGALLLKVKHKHCVYDNSGNDMLLTPLKDYHLDKFEYGKYAIPNETFMRAREIK